MPTIDITVSGPVGCGKSALMTEILVTLKAIGVDAEIVGQVPYDTGGDPAAMLDMYRDKMRVVIAEGFSPSSRHIDELEREAGDLSRALDRAHTILSNMALEHTTGWRGIFARWPIHHEPLRNDARRALPQIRAALNIEEPPHATD